MPSLRASSSKTRMNSSPTILRFSSGSETPASRERKRSCAWTCTSGTRKWLENVSTTCSASFSRRRPVDEDARAGRRPPMHQQRRHGRVDAARQGAEHALGADGGPDPLDLLLDHRGRRPGGRRAGDLVQEVLEDVLAVRRVHDLGVELDAVQAPARILERGDRRRRRGRRHRRAARRCGDGVPMAHPHDLLGGEVAEELRVERPSSALPNSASVRSTAPPRSRAISCIP